MLATPSSASNQAHPFASSVLEPASVQPLLLVPGQVSRTVTLVLLAATLSIASNTGPQSSVTFISCGDPAQTRTTGVEPKAGLP